tara:strand:- start:24 stop:518 length:495 start_codon:yes stop_codon:yes gene_type:complete
MWTLVIISHILMFVSFVMLSFSAFKGHFISSISGHITLNSYSISAIMIYVFTQSFIFFLIITINKNINAIIIENNLTIENNAYKKYKKKMHIHTSSNILIISTLAILFGAVHTGLMNMYIHNTLFIIGIFHYAYVIKVQYFCFKEISKIIYRINDLTFSKLSDG